MTYHLNSNPLSTSRVEINEIFAHHHNIEGTKNADEGRFIEALNNFTKAIELNPESHVSYFNRGTVKADLGDYEGAKKDFEIAREMVLRTHIADRVLNAWNI